MSQSNCQGTKEMSRSEVNNKSFPKARKFSFLEAINQKEKNKGQEMAQMRENMAFQPFLLERDDLGNLLKDRK